MADLVAATDVKDTPASEPKAGEEKARQFVADSMRKMRGDDDGMKAPKLSDPAPGKAQSGDPPRGQPKEQPKPRLAPPPQTDDDPGDVTDDAPEQDATADDDDFDDLDEAPTQEAPKLSAHIAKVARSFGLTDEDFAGMSDDEVSGALSVIASRMRNVRPPEQHPAAPAAKQEQPKGGKPFRLEYNREGIDDEIVKVIDTLTERYESRLEEISKQAGELRDWKASQEKVMAAQQQRAAINEFSKAVQKFTADNPEFARALGNGDFDKMTDKQRARLGKVASNLELLEKGYLSRGQAVPPMGELVRTAAMMTYGEQVMKRTTSTARDEIVSKLDQRAASVGPNASSRSAGEVKGRGKGDGMSAEAYVRSEFRKLKGMAG